jgi:FAD:protein FMN transferase
VTEASDTFGCFGGTCTVFVGGEGAREAVAAARGSLLAWHDRFTRFDADSELSRLNADPRPVVPVTPLMARFAAAVAHTAELSGGLVDATLLGELERAGYLDDLGAPLDLPAALRLAPARRPASGRHPPAIEVDFGALTVRREPGVRLDAGGLAKGMFADVLAETFRGRPSFAIDCAGDLRIGGAARRVQVASPFDGRVLHASRLADVGVATSGIGRRSWLDRDGRPAHHLLDPGTGRPAFTGVVQATAVAPTALEAEVRAKAAVLSGPDGAAAWLPHGGVVVLDDGTHHTQGFPPCPAESAARSSSASSWSSS